MEMFWDSHIYMIMNRNRPLCLHEKILVQRLMKRKQIKRYSPSSSSSSLVLFCLPIKKYKKFALGIMELRTQ